MNTKKSPKVSHKFQSKTPIPTVSRENFTAYNEPQELKVCNDCQVRYSHKSSSLSDPGVGKYNVNKFKKAPEIEESFRNSSYSQLGTVQITPMEEVETNRKEGLGSSPKSTFSAKTGQSQKLTREKSDLGNENATKNQQSSFIKVNDLLDGEYESHRLQILTEKGYIKRAGETLASLRSKLSCEIPESEKKKRGNVQDDDIGEDRFVKYSEEFATDLDKITQRFESNLKKNFENTAHNILHQHINNQSLLESDDIYKNRESKYFSQRESSKYSSNNRSMRNSGEYSKAPENNGEYSYISDTQPRRGGTGMSPLRKDNDSSVLPLSNKKWGDTISSKDHNSKINQSVSQDLPMSLYESKNSKGFQELNDSHLERTGDKKNPFTKSELGGTFRDDKYLITEENENNKAGHNLRQANERLKSQAKSILKTERKILSPPQNSERVKFIENAEDIDAEEKVAKLEELALRLIKENHFEGALECLVESEIIINNELEQNHPQQLYISYLLGECFIKLEDYGQAKQVLEKTIKKYEDSGAVEREKDSPFFYYYLGLLVLEAHVSMLMRSFEKAFRIYTKLIKASENYNKNQSAKDLIGIIPHILLVKYNMGECLRSAERLREADENLYEVAKEFDFHDSELLENHHVLFDIASYFLERKNEDAALEVLNKICEAKRYESNIENLNPTLFISAYDDLAGILFNRQQYTESAKYHELSFNLKVKWFGMKHIKVAYSLLALGKTYQMAGEQTKALQRFSSGLEILESIEGRTTFYSANTSFTMAKIHFSLKEYLRAIYLYERSLDIYTQLLGQGHPYCFRVFANLVHVCFESRSKEKLVEAPERLIKATHEADSPEVFGILNEIGNIYRKCDFPEIALNIYNLALRKYSGMSSSEIPLVSVYLVYINMGSACFYLKKYGDALHYYKEATNYFSSVQGGANPEIVLIYINVARVYKALGKTNEATLYLKKASTILTMIEKETEYETAQKLKNDIKILRGNHEK